MRPLPPGRRPRVRQPRQTHPLRWQKKRTGRKAQPEGPLPAMKRDLPQLLPMPPPAAATATAKTTPWLRCHQQPSSPSTACPVCTNHRPIPITSRPFLPRIPHRPNDAKTAQQGRRAETSESLAGLVASRPRSRRLDPSPLNDWRQARPRFNDQMTTHRADLEARQSLEPLRTRIRRCHPVVATKRRHLNRRLHPTLKRLRILPVLLVQVVLTVLELAPLVPVAKIPNIPSNSPQMTEQQT
mmetsp:Transcript_16980/g.47619  ORF Transcript_16980/g.47619 Transcript_16980/m.47619 type:complete len:241 (-) Transcript_16980:6256-6978(-)